MDAGDDMAVESPGAGGADSFNRLRQLDVKLSVSTTFAGSCLISLGNTVAKCLVNLPRVSASKQSTDSGQFTLELASNCLSHSEKHLERLKAQLVETFERHILLQNYPCQIIEAYIIVSNDDGGLLPALAMGMCLALIDCGIHVYDVVAACSVCLFRDSHGAVTTALDPTKEEESHFGSLDPDMTVVTLGYCCNLNAVALLYSKGPRIAESMNRALEVARVACNLIAGELAKALKQSHKWKEEKSNLYLQTEYVDAGADPNQLM